MLQSIEIKNPIHGTIPPPAKFNVPDGVRSDREVAGREETEQQKCGRYFSAGEPDEKTSNRAGFSLKQSSRKVRYSLNQCFPPAEKAFLILENSSSLPDALK